MPDSEQGGDAESAPRHSMQHEALSVFLGTWDSEGRSYGHPDQSEDDPRARSEPWRSACTGRWHTGEFFLVREEQAVVGGKTFDTLSVMGVDPATGKYFAQSFENHGFERRYAV